jgi:hypothetical protein
LTEQNIPSPVHGSNPKASVVSGTDFFHPVEAGYSTTTTHFQWWLQMTQQGNTGMEDREPMSSEANILLSHTPWKHSLKPSKVVSGADPSILWKLGYPLTQPTHFQWWLQNDSVRQHTHGNIGPFEFRSKKNPSPIPIEAIPKHSRPNRNLFHPVEAKYPLDTTTQFAVVLKND